MRVLVITFGTEGDVRPLAALCAALIEAGHEATFLGPSDALEAARELGVPAHGLPGAVRATLSAAGTTRGAAAGLAGVVNQNASAWLKLALDHGADCDAVVGAGLAAFIGLSAAEKLGVVGVGAGMFPITPTTEFASPFIPPGAIPAWANRLSFLLVGELIWRSLAGATNAARKAVGLPARRRLWSEHPMLYGFSRHLVPRPRDWPANAAVCGVWSSPPTEWSPPEALAAFLAAGEPPIYLGFGSMPVAEPRRLLEPLVAAIGGRRALFYPGWSGIAEPDLPSNVQVIGATPHDWLFPRTAMAIHHGGSGTTHAAAGAGVPSIVVPFAGDQRFWADRLRRAGVAPASIKARSPDSAAIAASIAFASRDDVRSRAAELGMALANENGPASAISHLEALTAGAPRPVSGEA
jgi:UDP:flavonoid glycosyltransferase YjiC (YdhE family)